MTRRRYQQATANDVPRKLLQLKQSTASDNDCLMEKISESFALHKFVKRYTWYARGEKLSNQQKSIWIKSATTSLLCLRLFMYVHGWLEAYMCVVHVRLGVRFRRGHLYSYVLEYRLSKSESWKIEDKQYIPFLGVDK